MKKILVAIAILLTSVFILASSNTVIASEKTVIYFKGANCLSCKALEENGFYDKVDALGFNMIIYDVEDPDVSNYDLSMYNFEDEPNLIDLWTAFGNTYGVTEQMATPTVFVGDTYYIGVEDIEEALENGDFEAAGQNALLEVNVAEQEAYNTITGFLGFLGVLGAGLLDGFNPCAIALLLLFVSLMSSNENKKALLLISITYISALFISYLLIGTTLFYVLREYADQVHLINTVISYIILVVCIILFSYNMYDYVVTKREEYGKVKNQLPKWIQRFNKKIMKRFADIVNNPDDKKNLFSIIALTFTLGLVMSFTEFLCTGQIYGIILLSIHNVGTAYAYVALIAYNIMFVLPLIIIAVLSIRGRGAMVISNWVRENLSTIKLLNALLFLFIGVYFLLRVLGIIVLK